MTTALMDQARQILKYSLGIGAIAIGADKFVWLVTDWDKYVAPAVLDVIPLSAPTFLIIVGIIEIIVGILILSKKTWIGALILMVWFDIVIINLILLGGYWDIIVRDLLLGLAALSLALMYWPERSASTTTNS